MWSSPASVEALATFANPGFQQTDETAFAVLYIPFSESLSALNLVMSVTNTFPQYPPDMKRKQKFKERSTEELVTNVAHEKLRKFSAHRSESKGE